MGTASKVYGKAERKGVGEMIKVYCDRCGKEIDGLHMLVIEIRPPVVRTMSDEAYAKGYQICRDCIEDVDEYIKAKQTDCPWK